MPVFQALNSSKNKKRLKNYFRRFFLIFQGFEANKRPSHLDKNGPI